MEKLKTQAQENSGAPKDKIPKHRIIFKIRRFETGFCRVEHTSNDGSTLVVQRLGSKMTPYKVVPTSDNSGVIQVVQTQRPWLIGSRICTERRTGKNADNFGFET